MSKEKLENIEDGNKAMLRGDIDTAMHRFRHILDQDPDDADALIGLASISFQRYEIEKGKQYLEMARESEPHNPRVLFRIGYIYEAEDDYNRAYEMYQKAHESAPEDPQIQSALERIQYLADGQQRVLHDGTYVGEHTQIGPRSFRFNIFSGEHGIIKAMKQFYEHIGQNFEPGFLHNFMTIGKFHSLVLLIAGMLIIGLSQNNGVLNILGIVVLCCSPLVLILNFMARFKLRRFLKDVRQHFIDETGYQIADPDRGTEELCRVTKKTSLLSMIFIFLASNWYFFSKSVEIVLADRVDLEKPAWWQFKKRKKLSQGKNIQRDIDDALNRHCLFHLRNSKALPNWEDGRWTDNLYYIKHHIQGEPAEDFDFKALDNSSFLTGMIRPFYMIIGVPLGICVWFSGLLIAATIVLAPLGEKIMMEIAPAVMTMRKPNLHKGIDSIPVKDNLVIRSELQPIRSIA